MDEAVYARLRMMAESKGDVAGGGEEVQGRKGRLAGRTESSFLWRLMFGCAPTQVIIIYRAAPPPSQQPVSTTRGRDEVSRTIISKQLVHVTPSSPRLIATR
jgi:hypothetical protein